MNKFENFKLNFEQFIYIIACIATLGLVYLIRIIITQGVIWALVRRDAFNKDYEDYQKELHRLVDTNIKG